MSGGKGSSKNKSFSENISNSQNTSSNFAFNSGSNRSSNFGQNSSQNLSNSRTFIDQSQQPFLDQLRQQGSNLATQQLRPGGQFQQGLAQQASALGGFLQGPQENPYLQGQIQSGLNLVNQNLQENILPSIGSDAQLAGQFGGGRQGVAEGVAMRDANRVGADFAQNLIGQDYQQQQARQLQALALAPSINQQGFSPLQNFGNLVGGPNILSQSNASGFASGITRGSSFGSTSGRSGGTQQGTSSGFATSRGKGSGNSKSLGF